jgi:hypothetical protein
MYEFYNRCCCCDCQILVTAIGLGIVNGLEALHLYKLVGGTCKTLTRRALCVLKKGEGGGSAHGTLCPIATATTSVSRALRCAVLCTAWPAVGV